MYDDKIDDIRKQLLSLIFDEITENDTSQTHNTSHIQHNKEKDINDNKELMGQNHEELENNQ